MIKWIYSQENESIMEDTKDVNPIVVMSIGNIPVEIIKKITNWHNANFANEKIESFLSNDKNVTPETTKVVMAILGEYEKFKDQEEVLNKLSPMTETVDIIQANGNDIQPNMLAKKSTVDTPKAGGFNDGLLSNIPVGGSLDWNKSPTLVSDNKGEVEKPKQKRQPKEGTEKKLSSEEFKLQMRERIVMADYWELLEIPEIPEGLSKNNRKVLVDLQNELETVFDKYLLIIQKM